MEVACLRPRRKLEADPEIESGFPSTHSWKRLIILLFGCNVPRFYPIIKFVIVC